MSKIDEYKAIKQMNTDDICALNYAKKLKANGEPDFRNDKGCLTFQGEATWDTDMQVYIHASYGYYGSSSSYPIRSQNMRKYLVRAMNSMSETIIDKAQLLMKEDIEMARKAAVKEANAVLERLGGEDER